MWRILTQTLKLDIRANGETNDVKIVNLSSLPLEALGLTNVTITWETTQIVFFAEL